jgi:L,D-transpeptidase catalytic domain
MLHRRSFLQAAAIGGLGLAAAPAQALGLVNMGGQVPEKLLAEAKAALERHADKIPYKDIIAIVDFSQPSSASRMHIVNLISGMGRSMMVAHGKGSDLNHTGYLQQFSNVMGSEATSSGAFVTTHNYSGMHGSSLRLGGLDPENDMAEKRGIVVHSAWYVSPMVAFSQGKIGRSEGCFAVSQYDRDELIAVLGEGRMIYAGRG